MALGRHQLLLLVAKCLLHDVQLEDIVGGRKHGESRVAGQTTLSQEKPPQNLCRKDFDVLDVILLPFRFRKRFSRSSFGSLTAIVPSPPSIVPIIPFFIGPALDFLVLGLAGSLSPARPRSGQCTLQPAVGLLQLSSPLSHALTRTPFSLQKEVFKPSSKVRYRRLCQLLLKMLLGALCSSQPSASIQDVLDERSQPRSRGCRPMTVSPESGSWPDTDTSRKGKLEQPPVLSKREVAQWVLVAFPGTNPLY